MEDFTFSTKVSSLPPYCSKPPDHNQSIALGHARRGRSRKRLMSNTSTVPTFQHRKTLHSITNSHLSLKRFNFKRGLLLHRSRGTRGRGRARGRLSHRTATTCSYDQSSNDFSSSQPSYKSSSARWNSSMLPKSDYAAGNGDLSNFNGHVSDEDEFRDENFHQWPHTDTSGTAVDQSPTSVVVHECYQLAFRDENSNLCIPHCCKMMEVEYNLPCPDVETFLANLSSDSLDLVQSTPYLYLPQSAAALQEFVEKSFRVIGKQMKRFMSFQLKRLVEDERETSIICEEDEVVLNPEVEQLKTPSIPPVETFQRPRKRALPLTVQWKVCDAEMRALRHATFNMLLRILPDVDVSSLFDCNTSHVDQLVECVIDSLYAASTATGKAELKLREPVVSLCFEPQKCLTQLREQVLTLVTLLCPFLELPPNFCLERDLFILLKNIQTQSP